MGKLVRDRIPEIIAAEGRTPTVRTLNDHEYEAALLDKLLEEATELRDAEPHRRLEEAADVYEVLLTILARQGMGADELTAASIEKRGARGSFTQRWWWEDD
jgi:predicted house-cleaning noncanonical NTP pyrophosphatase (MazG superfamily)